MSLKRYYISGLRPHIWEHPEGEMVYFEDYVTLWAENARLKAEVERLRKAGDEIIHEWSSGHGTDVENFTKALWVWTVAKEGKQP